MNKKPTNMTTIDPEENYDTKTRRRKPLMQPYVIGTWEDGVFTAALTQPEKPITTLADMLTWAAKNIEGAGNYSLIRKIPGALTMARQTTFFASFNMEEDDDTIPWLPNTKEECTK